MTCHIYTLPDELVNDMFHTYLRTLKDQLYFTASCKKFSIININYLYSGNINNNVLLQSRFLNLKILELHNNLTYGPEININH